MANLGSLRTPYRGMHIGYPGSAKTGALASLANVGYKLRILDFDGNVASLLPYVDDRAVPNIDAVQLFDRYYNDESAGIVMTLGVPDAFNASLRLMKEWKYKDGETEVNLGKSDDWGLDTIVVVDTLSTLAKVAKNRAIKMSNKTVKTMTSAVWGLAAADVLNLLGILKSKPFHLIVNSHKQILGPAEFIAQGDDDAIKEKKLEMIKEGMIPPRVYPISVTKPQAQSIHGELPIMLEFEKTTQLGKDVRLINTVGGPEIDVKIPGKNLKKTYPIETGLAEIFAALGYVAPGFGKQVHS